MMNNLLQKCSHNWPMRSQFWNRPVTKIDPDVVGGDGVGWGPV